MLFFVVYFYLLSHKTNEYLENLIPLLLILIFFTFFNFILAFEKNIFDNLREIPIWGGIYYGSLNLNEWAGLITLILFLILIYSFIQNDNKNTN